MKKIAFCIITLVLIDAFTGCGSDSGSTLNNKVDDITEAGKKSKYETHVASTNTERVGGLIVYDINSDLIIDIPEDYFFSFNDSDITYDELISEIGEPSGWFGSGIVRAYWRIGEDKYAVCSFMGEKLFLYIQDGDE